MKIALLILALLKDLPSILHDVKEVLMLLKSLYRFIRKSGDNRQTHEIKQSLKSALDGAAESPVETKRALLKDLNDTLRGSR